eukprot:403355993
MVELKILKYLDQDLYVKSAHEGDIEQHYICLICHGVVLNPTECRECQSIFCQGCIDLNGKKCPLRCRGELIKYSNYIKHFEECQHAEPKQECKHKCEANECMVQIKELQDKVEMLEIQSAVQVDIIETYGQRLRLLEEQGKINELKKSMKKIQKNLAKEKGNDIKEEQKTHEIQEEYKSLNSGEQKLNNGRRPVIPKTSVNLRPPNGRIDRQRDLAIRSNPTLSHRLAGRQNSHPSEDITCENNHHLKPYFDLRPEGLPALSAFSTLVCDVCNRIINHNSSELYYRCDNNCNWDMCKHCYEKRQSNQFC